MAKAESPKIILYTNHRCPFAHRVHTALSILNLPYTEYLVDLDTPRTPEYLAINPRGLVPTISYDGAIIPEHVFVSSCCHQVANPSRSGIVAQFLADAYPGPLLPPSNTTSGALERAQVAFFIDAFSTKVIPPFFAGLRSATEEEKTVQADKVVEAVVKELEPLLQNAAPYFGGNATPGFVEVITGSFLLRILSHSKYGLVAKDLNTKLETKAPAFYKWANEVVENDHVKAGVWDEEDTIARTKKRLAK